MTNTRINKIIPLSTAHFNIQHKTIRPLHFWASLYISQNNFLLKAECSKPQTQDRKSLISVLDILNKKHLGRANQGYLEFNSGKNIFSLQMLCDEGKYQILSTGWNKGELVIHTLSDSSEIKPIGRINYYVYFSTNILFL